MTNKARKYLSDIHYSIELIEQFVESTATFQKYKKDLKTKGAVERYLTIIGEAVHKFTKEDTGKYLPTLRRLSHFGTELYMHMTLSTMQLCG